MLDQLLVQLCMFVNELRVPILMRPQQSDDDTKHDTPDGSQNSLIKQVILKIIPFIFATHK